VCPGSGQGRKPRAYGSGRWVGSGQTRIREGRLPDPGAGASVHARGKGSWTILENRRIGVQTVTLLMDFVRPSRDRIPSLGKGKDSEREAQVWRLLPATPFFGRVMTMVSFHSRSPRLVWPADCFSGSSGQPGQPSDPPPLFGEQGELKVGQESNRSWQSILRLRLSVAWMQRRVDRIRTAGWKPVQSVPPLPPGSGWPTLDERPRPG